MNSRDHLERLQSYIDRLQLADIELQIAQVEFDLESKKVELELLKKRRKDQMAESRGAAKSGKGKGHKVGANPKPTKKKS